MDRVRSIIGVSAGRPDDDFYSTPRDATRLLLNCEKFIPSVWEPACGNGAISEILKEYGYSVFSSDIIQRGYAEQQADFFSYRSMPSECNSIVTNPPFRTRSNGKERRVEHWVEHGFSIGAMEIALFLKTTALAGKYRSSVFEKHLIRVLQFRDRVSLYRNDVVMKNGGMMDFAWFIFNPSSENRATIGWIP